MKKKILSLLVLLAAAVSGAWAEEVTIGDPTATTTNVYLPTHSLFEYSLSQQIYTADEIGMGGTINALTMWLKNSSSYARNLNIYMKEVDKSTFASVSDWVSMTNDDLVATATLDNGTTDPVETTFTLTTPFEYSGTGNLVICINDVTGSWSSGAGSVVMTASENQAIYAYRDGTTYDVTAPGVNGTLLNVKSVVKLDIEAAGGYKLTKAEGAEAHGTVAFTNADGNEITTAKEGETVTVTVTPATGYAVDETSGKWFAAVAASRRTPAETPTIDLLSDMTLTAGDVDETTGAQTYTFTMERANVLFDVTYKHRHIWDFSVSPDGTQLIATCQNQSGDCDVQVEITEIALPEELVYGVDCEAGVDLEAFNEALGGEAEAELVSAVYTGTQLNGGDAYGPTTEVPTLPGDYVVTVTVSAGGQDYVFSRQYTLNQKVIDNLMIQPIADCVYDGQVQSPDVVVKYGDIVLTLGTDYVVRYSENVNAGVGMVAVYGIENYDGVSYGTFNILKKELTADMIEVIADQSYTGQAVEPAVVVKYSDNLVDGRVYVLKPGHDYTVSYENNVEVGTATVIVTAADGNYSGEIKATFNIVGTTGIGAANSQQPTANRYYDLGGRKVSAKKKGVVIVDGKKVVKK